ncbi:Cof-type HAD-IIB family hydrolase [Kriegella aquimaris]|uniref:Cof subfamily of IIB subfamily of haloacid dehalogenase superfamily/HAD-superfamily hydrolase, subfamily IIB n=1 Tax=Kriegella aquimaris TaxID=192904 RepID=A0A1G9WIB7_9FLAO|nr:Cof-type HAD-IIB family hydrolase [Kriegella aquimaris]SDM84209.1 hypothetical protein SAMN04488514_115119 [Kriegella aquimaris]
MKYKILCSDLDGTLLSTKSDVSDFTIAEVSRIRKETKIILVSARMPRSMTYLQRRLGIEHEPIICYNGALVLDGETEIASTLIDLHHVTQIHTMADALLIKLGLYYKDEWYVEEDTERVQKEILYTRATPIFRATSETISDWKDRKASAHKIMLMGTKETADILYPLLVENFSESLNLYRSNDTLIEVAPKSVSKLSAIKQLLNEGSTINDVISFGDNYNDIEMLKYSGYGVAVGNAREEVKAIAKSITLKNTEHGVAQFIKEHLL